MSRFDWAVFLLGIVLLYAALAIWWGIVRLVP